MPLDWSPLWPALRYASLATLLALLLAVPLAWLLQNTRFPGLHLLDAAANLPLILPPGVLVYYLLSTQERWPLHFTWRAAVPLSAICTLPLLLRMIRAGLAAVNPALQNAARSLGATEWRTFWRITVPLAWRALTAAVLAGFARSFADCGATALLAGGASLAWPLTLIVAVSLAALYLGNRLRQQVTL